MFPRIGTSSAKLRIVKKKKILLNNNLKTIPIENFVERPFPELIHKIGKNWKVTKRIV